MIMIEINLCITSVVCYWQANSLTSIQTSHTDKLINLYNLNAWYLLYMYHWHYTSHRRHNSPLLDPLHVLCPSLGFLLLIPNGDGSHLPLISSTNRATNLLVLHISKFRIAIAIQTNLPPRQLE